MPDRFDRRFVAVPLATGVYGIVIAAAIHHFGDMRNSIFLSIFAGPGAALAGLIVSKLFGKRGWEGWAFAYFAAFLATTLGVGLSGLAFAVFGLSWAAAVLAPLAGIYVFSVIVYYPPVMLIWLTGAALVHLAALKAATGFTYLYDLDE